MSKLLTLCCLGDWLGQQADSKQQISARILQGRQDLARKALFHSCLVLFSSSPRSRLPLMDGFLNLEPVDVSCCLQFADLVDESEIYKLPAEGSYRTVF
jgi:hypothetical protein